MKKNIIIVLLLILNALYSFNSYSQTNNDYNNIETKNVLYYKVEEIVKMTFGGTTTHYTVSDLSLISKVNLGPDNIRIITPIYKDKNLKKKSYYIETRNLQKDSVKTQNPTHLVEIKIDNNNIVIPENTKMEKVSLAIAIDKLTSQKKEEKKTENPKDIIVAPTKVKTPEKQKTKETVPIPVGYKKTEEKKINTVSLAIDNNQTTEVPNPSKQEESKPEVKNYASINIVDVYERVAQKGYKSAYMFKEMANSYFFKNQMDKAVKWYGELFAMTTELEPIYYYRYGEALKKTGNLQKGNEMIEKFNKLVE